MKRKRRPSRRHIGGSSIVKREGIKAPVRSCRLGDSGGFRGEALGKHVHKGSPHKLNSFAFLIAHVASNLHNFYCPVPIQKPLNPPLKKRFWETATSSFATVLVTVNAARQFLHSSIEIWNECLVQTRFKEVTKSRVQHVSIPYGGVNSQMGLLRNSCRGQLAKRFTRSNRPESGRRRQRRPGGGNSVMHDW